MIRMAFEMRLKPGALDEYVRLHNEVPTKYRDLAAAIREAGIYREVVFVADPLLIVYAEVSDTEAYSRLFAMEVHDRWAELMAPLMEKGPDGRSYMRWLENVWEVDLGS